MSKVSCLVTFAVIVNFIFW